jgi:hypothetical protein
MPPFPEQRYSKTEKAGGIHKHIIELNSDPVITGSSCRRRRSTYICPQNHCHHHKAIGEQKVNAGCGTQA